MIKHFKELQESRVACGQERILRNIDRQSGVDGRFINFSSNDYLGLAQDIALQKRFFAEATDADLRLSSASSRLLTGHTDQSADLENLLSNLYGGKSALSFGSGYHANSGIIPAITDKNTLIIADKLVHASIIEGLRLSDATSMRFRHNDLKHLSILLEKYSSEYERVILMTESIFSMDGDEAPLKEMVALKGRYPNLELYIDEAHAVGVRGLNGLGCVEDYDLIDKVDYIIGTMGKALASMGAYVICDEVVKAHLINTCRTFIFTTAPAPINQAWSAFILRLQSELDDQRDHLKAISNRLKAFLETKGIANKSDSHIIPIIIGDNHSCLAIAEQLQAKGLWVLPVRPPTVPEGSSRLRISLSASISDQEIDYLIDQLDNLL